MSDGFEFITSKDETPERIKRLVEKYKFTLATLSNLTKMDSSWLKNLVDGKASMDDLHGFDRVFFSDNIMLLEDALPNVNEDMRIQSLIYTLVDMLGISYETFAIYAGIELEELQNFLEDANSMSHEKRYKLAVVSLFLHYVFKKPPQIKTQK